jgi:hypothetical protein
LFAYFYQKYKKLVPTIVVIFVGLLLSCFFYLLYHALYQWLISFKLDLIGKVGSWKNNKNIIRNTSCHKKGNTYGNKLINCISLLETCALFIMLLIALINLVAVGGINTSLFNVEQIEEFIAWKGAFELAYLLENTDDAPYKYEVYDILHFLL